MAQSFSFEISVFHCCRGGEGGRGTALGSGYLGSFHQMASFQESLSGRTGWLQEPEIRKRKKKKKLTQIVVSVNDTSSGQACPTKLWMTSSGYIWLQMHWKRRACQPLRTFIPDLGHEVLLHALPVQPTWVWWPRNYLIGISERAKPGIWERQNTAVPNYRAGCQLLQTKGPAI